MGCTNSPSGAIDYSTTVYYLDGKFHKDIPEEYKLASEYANEPLSVIIIHDKFKCFQSIRNSF